MNTRRHRYWCHGNILRDDRAGPEGERAGVILVAGSGRLDLIRDAKRSRRQVNRISTLRVDDRDLMRIVIRPGEDKDGAGDRVAVVRIRDCPLNRSLLGEILGKREVKRLDHLRVKVHSGRLRLIVGR